MARLHQVHRDEVRSEFVLAVYDHLFEGRDPVDEPGTEDGTRGDWWTVFANSPDVLEHAVGGFLLYQSPKRVLDPVVREIGQLRAGVATQSAFVIRQHRLALSRLGVETELIDALCVREPVGLSEATDDVVQFVNRLAAHDDVEDALFRRLQQRLGDEGLLELAYISAMYVMHGALSKALQLEDDDPDR